ncbi:MAG: 3-dehydroquinate synthase [SAR324 cluster bacterium]|nr:3-dehydroquinate synthase [SAR324 cluster bacterium]
MKELRVNIPGYEYNIHIGQGISTVTLPETVTRTKTDMVVVVTNETINRIYPGLVAEMLRETGITVKTCVLPDGEIYKNIDTLNQIYNFLFEHHANRRTLLIAFGGGVIGDMTGFAAATFMRGIPFMQVPTTLLADVDSSVGGKTAVNHPLGKNAIGAFKQPIYVCIDLNFLKTLPERELKAGYFELIKHGFIHDAALFDFLQNYRFENLDMNFFEEAIFRSCQVKARVVEQDEKETGLRATLNFGHTLGHLLETHTGYTQYLHGEAVGVGMLFAAFVSHQWNFLDTKDFQRVSQTLEAIVEPMVLPALDFNQFQELMLHDKKADQKSVHFILLKNVGTCFINKHTSVESLWEVFQTFLIRFPKLIRLETQGG